MASSRGKFIAGGVLGILASINLLIVALLLSSIASRKSVVGWVSLYALASLVLASITCGSRRWAARASGTMQLVAVFAIGSLPCGGHTLLLAGSSLFPVLLNSAGGAVASAVFLLFLFGSLQVVLSALSAVLCFAAARW